VLKNNPFYNRFTLDKKIRDIRKASFFSCLDECQNSFTTLLDETGGKGKFEESSEKSSEKIIAIIKENPKISAREIAQNIGLTSRAVEKQIAILRKEGVLKRIGGAKGGYWKILENR